MPESVPKQSVKCQGKKQLSTRAVAVRSATFASFQCTVDIFPPDDSRKRNCLPGHPENRHTLNKKNQTDEGEGRREGSISVEFYFSEIYFEFHNRMNVDTERNVFRAAHLLKSAKKCIMMSLRFALVSFLTSRFFWPMAHAHNNALQNCVFSSSEEALALSQPNQTSSTYVEELELHLKEILFSLRAHSHLKAQTF